MGLSQKVGAHTYSYLTVLDTGTVILCGKKVIVSGNKGSVRILPNFFHRLQPQVLTSSLYKHRGTKCVRNLTVSSNSGALVRQRTIPTERHPLVGDVSVKF
jgi:hypothetical protein